jgi:four helix bundle protein
MNTGGKQRSDLFDRTKSFAVRIFRMCEKLPRTMPAKVVGSQVLRSGTSVGAQYREARRARSNAEFVSKLRSAQQELEETSYWLELIVETELLPSDRVAALHSEAEELMKMLAASIRTARRNSVK